MNRRQFLGGTAVSLAAAASFARAHEIIAIKAIPTLLLLLRPKPMKPPEKRLPTVLKQVKSVWHTASDCWAKAILQWKTAQQASTKCWLCVARCKTLPPKTLRWPLLWQKSASKRANNVPQRANNTQATTQNANNAMSLALPASKSAKKSLLNWRGQ